MVGSVEYCMIQTGSPCQKVDKVATPENDSTHIHNMSNGSSD